MEPAAPAGVSKALRRLTDRQLIARSRSRRLADVRLLKEDGSGDAYTRPDERLREDRWLQLPHSYWTEGYFETLGLTAKVMLLIALSRPDRFPLPRENARDWYGVSADSPQCAGQLVYESGTSIVCPHGPGSPQSSGALRGWWCQQLC